MTPAFLCRIQAKKTLDTDLVSDVFLLPCMYESVASNMVSHRDHHPIGNHMPRRSEATEMHETFPFRFIRFILWSGGERRVDRLQWCVKASQPFRQLSSSRVATVQRMRTCDLPAEGRPPRKLKCSSWFELLSLLALWALSSGTADQRTLLLWGVRRPDGNRKRWHAARLPVLSRLTSARLLLARVRGANILGRSFSWPVRAVQTRTRRNAPAARRGEQSSRRFLFSLLSWPSNLLRVECSFETKSMRTAL